MIVLIGFMGAGKTTIGHMVAERLGMPFLDSDLVIERQQGRAIKEIFATDGEPTFRQIEHDTIVDLLAGDDVVLALGGGAAEHAGTQAALRGHDVVYLNVTLEEALLRVGRDEFRPVMHAPDLEGRYRSRLPVFQECASITVETTGRRASDITTDVLTDLARATERPGVASVLATPAGGTYRISVGTGLIDRVEELLPPLAHAEQAFVVHTGANGEIARRIAEQLDARWTATTLELEPETVGTWAGAGDLIARLAAARAHRHDVVVAVGGETLCETVGLAASVYHRGMRLALVPTTLTAQVDSCVGGKTAVSLPQAHRVAGSWHQPVAVICDPNLSAQPDHPDWLDGLAELAKHALVGGGDLFDALQADRAALLAGDLGAVTELTIASVRLKAAIVSADEREQGERLALSYGHTLANAIEQVHGPLPGSVGLGMLGAAHLAHELDLLDEVGVELHRSLLQSLGLPTQHPMDVDAVLQQLTRDKRYRGGLRSVLLRGVGQPVPSVRVTSDQVRRALTQLTDR